MSKVCVFLAEGCEEVEALMVVDLLRRAGIETFMVSVTSSLQVTGSHGIQVKADRLFEEMFYSDIDALVLPGGIPGTPNLANHLGLVELLKEFYQKDKMLAAICAAPSVLGDLGLLAGKKATCHPGFESHLLKAQVVEDEVAADGNVVTSRGLGTAIPFGLQLIRCLADEETAQKVQDAIVYRK
ncbi:DJ-1 family glyoxalase III [Diplocloster agilis]|uniref:DJ-1 family glyoxalase III n=1 Tax=Diplocloster agilis TaxID=2850323 RepID=UPI000821A3A4|nr:MULTISPECIES: DJ-1 family glyoxalase III [Lachnospiraceae]MBU9746496.1 DJ-1/PfpI family protein [Diplocloster agilis]MCU6736223.1 DJ-1/PfpI family protein [Suonthocola fibrivorans]SCJ88045.1 Chaperone protein YajL [uncultured Clostridium sp.]